MSLWDEAAKKIKKFNLLNYLSFLFRVPAGRKQKKKLKNDDSSYIYIYISYIVFVRRVYVIRVYIEVLGIYRSLRYI